MPEFINSEYEAELVKGKELKKIPITKLRKSIHNTYDPYVDLDSLIDNIRAVGLLTPLAVVGPYKDGMYEILCGERRFHALQHLVEDGVETYKEVPCYIIGDADMDELQQKLIVESANIETRPQTYIHEHRFNVVEILIALQKKEGFKNHELTRRISKYIGGGTTNEQSRLDYARSYARVGKGDPFLVQAVRDKKLNILQAIRLSALPIDQQAQAALQVVRGDATVDEVLLEGKKKTKEPDAEAPAARVAEEISTTRSDEPATSITAAPQPAAPARQRADDDEDVVGANIIPGWKDLDEDFDGGMGVVDGGYGFTFGDEDLDARLRNAGGKYDTEHLLTTDPAGRINSDRESSRGPGVEKRGDTIPAGILSWAKQIVQKDVEILTDAEVRAIQACIQVAEQFEGVI